MMTKLRESTAIIMWIVILAFVGLIVVEWGADYSGTSGSQGADTVGVINGEEISLRTFQQAMQNAARQKPADTPRDNGTMVREVWDAMLGEILLRQEVESIGIQLSDQEVAYFARNSPPAAVQSLPTFQREGQFDPSLYQQFLTDRNTYDDENASTFVLQVEAMTRNYLVNQRLQGMLLETVRVTPAEVQQQFTDANEKVSIDYVFVASSTVPEDQATVAEDEIVAKYNEMAVDLHHPAQVRISAVVFPRIASAADSADVAVEIERLRSEIVDAGADFADMAVAVSEDESSAPNGGELGTFGRGAMVPAFEDVAFALQPGEVSQPVQTQFGWHLIKVDEIVEEEGETKVSARHILLKYRSSPETDDAMLEAAEVFQALAIERGFDAAAEIEDIVARDLGYVAKGQDLRGLGSGTQWVVNRFLEAQPGDVSPVGSVDGSYYVTTLTETREEGTAPLDEVRQQVEYTVRNEKRAAVAGQVLEAVRAAGGDFAAAALAAGLEVRQSGPFGRTDFVPGVGRAGKFTAAAFALQPGDVSDIVTQGNGAYLLHQTERTAADDSLFEQQRPAIEAQLLETRQREALNSWYAQLYERGDIQDYRHNFFYSF
jgi:peptidyl-prolyl cis-trans isomerase D